MSQPHNEENGVTCARISESAIANLLKSAGWLSKNGTLPICNMLQDQIVDPLSVMLEEKEKQKEECKTEIAKIRTDIQGAMDLLKYFNNELDDLVVKETAYQTEIYHMTTGREAASEILKGILTSQSSTPTPAPAVVATPTPTPTLTPTRSVPISIAIVQQNLDQEDSVILVEENIVEQPDREEPPIASNSSPAVENVLIDLSEQDSQIATAPTTTTTSPKSKRILEDDNDTDSDGIKEIPLDPLAPKHQRHTKRRRLIAQRKNLPDSTKLMHLWFLVEAVKTERWYEDFKGYKQHKDTLKYGELPEEGAWILSLRRTNIVPAHILLEAARKFEKTQKSIALPAKERLTFSVGKMIEILKEVLGPVESFVIRPATTPRVFLNSTVVAYEIVMPSIIILRDYLAQNVMGNPLYFKNATPIKNKDIRVIIDKNGNLAPFITTGKAA